MFIVVDLPEPDGPMTATKSPRATSRSTPFSAWKRPAPSPKVLVIPRSAMSGSAIYLLAPASCPVMTLSPACTPLPADFGQAAVGLADDDRDRLRLAVRADHPDLLPGAARVVGILRLRPARARTFRLFLAPARG